MSEASADKIATWVWLCIGAGLDCGITPKQMFAALQRKKLAECIKIMDKRKATGGTGT